MIRLSAVLLAIAIAFGVPNGPGLLVAGDGEAAHFAAACDHYRLRSGPKRHAEQGAQPKDFAAFLAEVCSAALISLDDGTPKQRGHARLLLSRIALLHETVQRMNQDRAARTDGLGLDRPRVTATGEFLIAHNMGLLIIYDAWLDTGAGLSLASYP